MNDDTDKPLNPVGDAALEARITAWVLGEASPFEAAELEEICARDPEARLFERRLRVLHGFIVEDRKVAADEEWKLPAEKRAKIEALFDEEPVVLGEGDREPEKVGIRYVRKPVAPRETGRRALLALAACTVISAAGWVLFSSVGESSKEAVAMRVEANVSAKKATREEQARYLDELRKAVLAQEDAVEDKRKLLAQIIRNENVVWKDPSLSAGARNYTRVDEAESAAKALVDLGQEKIQLETLLKYDGPQLMNYASGLSLPDSTIPQLLPQYQEQKRQYDAMKSQGLAANHPKLQASEKAVQAMEKDLSDEVGNLRETLKAKLALSNEQLARLQQRADAKGDAAIKQGVANQSFVDSKNDFETSQRVLEQLKIKLISEEMRMNASDDDAALASADKIEFIAGGAGSVSGAGVGISVPASPAPATMPAAPMAVPSQRSAGEMDSLAAVEGKAERGRAADESLAKLADEPYMRRSKSSASELSAAAKPSLQVEGRADMPKIETATAAPAAATGAIASNGLGDRVELGKELAFGRDEKPAEVEADASDRFGFSLGNAPANSSFDLRSRFSGEAPKAGYAYMDSSDAGGRLDESPLAMGGADPFASGGAGALGRSRTNADFIGEIAGVTIPGIPADPGTDVGDIMTAGNRSGLGAVNRNSIDAILNNPDRPADAAGAADALVDKDSVPSLSGTSTPFIGGLVGSLQQSASDPESAVAGAKIEAQGAAGPNALAKDTSWFSTDEKTKEMADSQAWDGKNAALTDQHGQNTDEVRRKLYTAEGNYNLGKFDDASKSYEDVLRVDPNNKAARRGMESVAQAKSDYYRAAYDQTRSQLLAEVDRAWELAVPPTNGLSDLKELETAKKASTPQDLLPRLEKAIREEEEKLQQDPNSAEIQNQIQLLAKVRDDLRGKVDAKAKEAEKQEKGPEPVALAETLTSAEPFSTFSLHVSDASFKMAKAALDRGEVPAADGIRPEEFYNAFDYGDPAPANGEPVVCAVEQSAHPALPQRNLLRIGVKTGSQGRGGSTPLNLTLLLDSSGSMEREDRNAGLANAVRQLSGLLKEGDTVSVIGFARQPRLLVDRLPGNRAQELNAIFAQTPSEGGTNLEEGLKLGEELALRQFNVAAQNRIVLFTDGAANLGDAKPETLQAKVEQMRQNGIAFDAAGFGTEGLNDKLLERLTRNGNGRYYIVDRAEDADANFAKQLAGAFRPAAENVKVQVRFNPARVAKYKLIGFEEHRLKKEDFRNDAVDAAEMAAEEAGNALYQIEALPQGEGEVGEVSVRFRDVASGQMVERTWTIPYEAQAPAFDQATPSIQLAGIAAFAAEKLRAAPMADAVDFQQLAPVMAKVKARYASSKPVAELESMIGKLK